MLANGVDVSAAALIERSRQLAATPLGDRDHLASLLLGGSFRAISVPLEVLAHSSASPGFWTIAPIAKRGRWTKIVAELRRCSGTDFDPVVVEALATAVSSTP